MGEIAHLPIDSEGAAMLGIAMFVATVAFPEDLAKRTRVAEAARAFALQVAKLRRPALKIQVKFLAPSSRALSQQIQQAGDRLALRRFRACEMAMHRMLGGKRLTFKIKRATGRLVEPLRVERMTTMQLAAEMAETMKRDATAAKRYLRTATSAGTALKHVWRESEPVLHLAFALRSELEERKIEPWRWPALLFVPDSIALLRRLIERGEASRAWLARFANLPLNRERQIRLLPEGCNEPSQ